MSLRSPLAVCCVALLLLAGCASLGPPPSDPQSDRVADRMAAAIDAIDRYRYGGRVHVRASKDGQSTSVGGTIEGAGNATRHVAVNTAEIEGNSQRSYLDGYARYTPCDTRFAEHDYYRQSLDDSRDWQQYTPLGSLTDPTLAERTTFVRNDTLDGRPVAVIVLHVDPGALAERQRSLGGVGPAFDAGAVRNVTARVWVDRETDRPRRVRLRVRTEEGGASATATIRYEISYPATLERIELPGAGAVTTERSAGCPA